MYFTFNIFNKFSTAYQYYKCLRCLTLFLKTKKENKNKSTVLKPYQQIRAAQI